MQDKEGKKCLFMIKSLQKSFEISASDKKKRQEWIQGESQEKMHEGQKNKKNIFVLHCLFFLKKIKSNEAHGHRRHAVHVLA